MTKQRFDSAEFDDKKGSVLQARRTCSQGFSTDRWIINWDPVSQLADNLSACIPKYDELAAVVSQLAAPHRVLESLDEYTDACFHGSITARRSLRKRLRTLAHRYPGLERLSRTLANSLQEQRDADPVQMSEARRSVSFDGIVRLASATAVSVPVAEQEELERALDTIIGLSCDALIVDRLLSALHSGGIDSVVALLNELHRVAPFRANFAPRTLTLGLPGLPPGLPGLPRKPSDLLGDLFNIDPRAPLDEIPAATATSDVLAELIARVRGRKRPDADVLDAHPPWWDALGIDPPESIPQEEIRRVRCLIDMKQALILREEPPPPRPVRLVWSDSISQIDVGGPCEGNDVVLHGSFGPYSPDLGVMLPTIEGCGAFPIAPQAWTPTAITIKLPPGISSGPVGLVDLNYVRLYDEWASQINRLTKRILEDAACALVEPPSVSYLPPFSECAPVTALNHLRAGVPVIRSFQVNGYSQFTVEPGQFFQLQWDLVNVEEFSLISSTPDAPGFAGQGTTDNPPGNHLNLGPFMVSRSTDATYQLRAKGPCGQTFAQVTVLLRKVPVLQIAGVEHTQAIQTFGESGTPSNSIPVVASKQTIVRVYVHAENLGDFVHDAGAGQVRISGELRFMSGTGKAQLPLATAVARAGALIDRSKEGHTLNFRIPPEFAVGTRAIRINVWMDKPIPFPGKPDVNAYTWTIHSISWINKSPFKVHFVRVSSNNGGAIDEPSAIAVMRQAFDLLPTPDTFLAPARIPVWHTTADISNMDGIHDLLAHLEDQHDCTASEAIFFWEDECPDDDEAVWVGLVNGAGGVADVDWFTANRNTAVASSVDRLDIAHELGHTLSLNHVNPSAIPAKAPDGAYDNLPGEGAIKPGDAFDPTAGKVKEVLGSGYAGLWDMMTYASNRWISRPNWLRLLNKF